MAMLIELFGPDILNATLDEVKTRIRALPPSQQERRSYLMHEWSVIKGVELTQDDFFDVEY